jgi:hypothetical protein
MKKKPKKHEIRWSRTMLYMGVRQLELSVLDEPLTGA